MARVGPQRQKKEKVGFSTGGQHQNAMGGFHFGCIHHKPCPNYVIAINNTPPHYKVTSILYFFT
jgi:hypothetical protein